MSSNGGGGSGSGIPSLKRSSSALPRPPSKLPLGPAVHKTPSQTVTPGKIPQKPPAATVPAPAALGVSGLSGLGPAAAKRASVVPAAASKRSSMLVAPSKRSSFVPPAASTPAKPKQPLPLPSKPSTATDSGSGPIERGTAPKSVGHVSQASTSTTSSRSSIVRPASRTTQQRTGIPPPSFGKLQLKTTANDRGYAQASPFNRSRNASRQESRDGSIESHEEHEPSSTTSPRPSLTERAVQSISNLPATPKDRRRSSFFSPMASPIPLSMPPPPRPGSSMSRTGGNGSRPGTSDGGSSRPPSRLQSPGKRAPPSIASTSRMSSNLRRTNIQRSISAASSAREPEEAPVSTVGDTTAADNVPELNANVPVSTALLAKPTAIRPKKSRASMKSVAAGDDGNEGSSEKRVPSNSSVALREQIAAAKAAARKEREKTKHDSPQSNAAVGDTAFKFDAHEDPFNQGPKDGKHILRNRITSARMDGKLNISSMGLKEIPSEVLNMYSASAIEESNVMWSEMVDLTRLVMADNEFESLDEAVFPDISSGDLGPDDEATPCQFAGLELLDLHGNALATIPMGFRRLERLTTLNLARNKIDDSALDIIAQIGSLKDLKLAHNTLSGHLPTSLCQLRHLERLDLEDNRLLGLPEAMRDLHNLKSLNVSGNQLTALPMEAIQQLPLVELDASKNALIGSVFPLGTVSAHPTLQILNVAHNSLAALAFSEAVDFPELRSLDVTNNHLTALPMLNAFTKLHTLVAGDNKITELPPGFTTLQSLRTANFTSNEIRLIDPEIARMDNLETLVLAANPLREKKFLTMNAADIKRDMRSRLALDDASVGEDEVWADAMENTSRPASAQGPPGWNVRPNGSLDLSSKSLSDETSDILGAYLERKQVRELYLQSNNISYIFPTLGLGRDLRTIDMSNNTLGRDYLTSDLELPSLKEFSLSRCRLGNLEPLTRHLVAPNLQSLNITVNRLAGPLPTLRQAFPSLTSLWAGDNRFTSITATAIRGLTTVNLSSNDIEQLPAEIGLLWDEGLKNFEVGSNAFRVPNYRILEKGTEATLRWLRARLPASEGDARTGFDGVD